MITGPDFEKKHIIIFSSKDGDKLTYLNDNVVIRNSENKIKCQVTCYQLFCIMVIGNVSITSGLIQRAQKFKYSICLLNNNLKVYHLVNGRMEGNTLLHRYQYREDRPDIARWIVRNKILNQKHALKKIRNKVPSIKEAIEKLDHHIELLSSDCIAELESLLGIEGSASRVYFPNIFLGCTEWKGRKPRVKNDFVNATLDIGYTVLFNYIDAVLQLFGFDVYQGVLHTNFYMRKSLVCDIMEPFRTIVDWKVRTAINLGQCKQTDFECINNQWVLKYNKNSEYVSMFVQETINYKMEIFRYIQSYYRAFMKNVPICEYPVVEI